MRHRRTRPLKTVDLHPLSSDYQKVSGTTLWGPTVNDAVGGTPTGVQIDMPESTACSGDYIPVSTEVRVVGVDSGVVDINDPRGCSYLANPNTRFADCWSRVSNIRDFKDDPRTQPWFQEVTVNGGSTGNLCTPDVMFARTTGTSCDYTVSVSVDWHAAAGLKGKNFNISIGGDQLQPPNGPDGDPNGVWTSSGLSNNDVAGRSDMYLQWTCKSGANGNGPSCGGSGAPGVPVQSLFLATSTKAPLLSLVRTSSSAQPSGGQPGAALQWFRAGNTAQRITIYPTVGLQSSLYPGMRRVLRYDDSSTSQAVACDPANQGQEFDSYRNGCQPWYTYNDYSGPPWWLPPAPGACPDKNGIQAQSNSQGTPWQCVLNAPGTQPNIIGDGIATAIGNCASGHIQNNGCNLFSCTNKNYYDPSKPNQWALGTGPQVPASCSSSSSPMAPTRA